MYVVYLHSKKLNYVRKQHTFYFGFPPKCLTDVPKRHSANKGKMMAQETFLDKA